MLVHPQFYDKNVLFLSHRIETKTGATAAELLISAYDSRFYFHFHLERVTVTYIFLEFMNSFHFSIIPNI